jgi:hypothetical protein
LKQLTNPSRNGPPKWKELGPWLPGPEVVGGSAPEGSVGRDLPGGSAPGSILGDSGGETRGVVTCGSAAMDVLVEGSQVICRGKVDGQW